MHAHNIDVPDVVCHSGLSGIFQMVLKKDFRRDSPPGTTAFSESRNLWAGTKYTQGMVYPLYPKKL